MKNALYNYPAECSPAPQILEAGAVFPRVSVSPRPRVVGSRARSVLCSVCSLLMLSAASSWVRAADRPNFLFILADDLGLEWLSCYGSEGQQTPNIDRLAAAGVRFENVWATPLCTPTRLEMLTGRYPFRTGWTVHNDVPRWGPPCFDWNREICLVRPLRAAGYATAIAGKWQVNDLRTHPDALDRHGFDEHCVWPGFETGNPASPERYFDPFVQTNGKREVRRGKFGPDVFREFLIDFMQRHKEGPFFAYYSMVLPHPPMTKTPRNLDTTASGPALYHGMVDYIDFEVGELVKSLRALALDRNTVVIFASDNGAPGLKMRMRGLDVVGGKTKLTEAGIHEPLIVTWPGRIKPAVRDDLVDFSDILPTVLDVAGTKPPENVLDGRSFGPVLLGQTARYAPREWIFSQLGSKRVVRDKRYKLWSDGRLFDLTADPLEQHDLATGDAPDSRAARQRLQSVLDSLPPDVKLPFTRSIGE
ncbi:MAG: sulfatase-like hydrolase/transferase [Planctomycetes bacterium]|nr:sulfatase-like hydrolase/transferase [Planctomycetota bacterium]